MSGRTEYEAYRRHVLAALHGRVVEIGAGRGRNLAALSADVRWQGLEPDRRRHAQLARMAAHDPRAIAPLHATAEDIPLPKASIDGVLSVVTLCSVKGPQAALSEIRRVLRPGGLFAFAEHVVAPVGSGSRRAQRVVAPISRVFDHGCDPLRDTEATIRGSGLEVLELRRFALRQPLGVQIPYIAGIAAR